MADKTATLRKIDTFTPAENLDLLAEYNIKRVVLLTNSVCVFKLFNLTPTLASVNKVSCVVIYSLV